MFVIHSMYGECYSTANLSFVSRLFQLSLLCVLSGELFKDTEKLYETNEHLNTSMKPTMRNLKRRLSTNTVEETQKYYFYSYCSKFSQY